MKKSLTYLRKCKLVSYYWRCTVTTTYHSCNSVGMFMGKRWERGKKSPQGAISQVFLLSLVYSVRTHDHYCVNDSPYPPLISR